MLEVPLSKLPPSKLPPVFDDAVSVSCHSFEPFDFGEVSILPTGILTKHRGRGWNASNAAEGLLGVPLFVGIQCPHSTVRRG